MSESDQFRQYADEALRWVAQSKTEEEKRLLFELALTWTQAAFATDHIGIILSGSTPTQSPARGLVKIGVNPLKRGTTSRPVSQYPAMPLLL